MPGRPRFDPRAPETFSVVWTADVHYGIGNGDKILPPMLKEVNALDPRPAFFGIAGDLILRASLRFGQVPDEKQKREAIGEFQAFKEHLDLLDRRIPAHLTLGNHDTYPGEGARRSSRKSFRIGRNTTSSPCRGFLLSSSTAAAAACCRRSNAPGSASRSANIIGRVRLW